MSDTSNTSEHFLHNGGECGELLRAIDWSNHTLGLPAYWPQSLKSTVGIILHSRFPMFLFWGPELFCFYNDAYRPSLGNEGKHPYLMGQRGEDGWPEIWPIIKPLIDQVLAGEGATWSEDQLIPIFRNGEIEDVYWTFSYSPVIDESGKIAGVLVTCSETTDKIKILQKLEEHKNELEFAIDAAQMGTWDYNPETNKFKGNYRTKEWFGLSSADEIDLQYAIDSVADSDRKRVVDAIKNALEYSSGGNYDIEYAIVNPNTKKETIVHAKGKAWFNENKIAYRFNGTLEDVTAKATARKKIEDNEQKIRSIVKNTPFPMGVYIGREMRIELANQAILDIWGKGNDVVGKLYSEVLPELNNQSVFEQLDEVFTTGVPFQSQNAPIELLVNGKPTTYYFNYNFTPLFDDKGNIYGVMNTAVDVTEQVKSRIALSESEKKFRNTVKHAPVGITIFSGRDYFVEMANDTYLQVIDRTEEEFVGRSLFDSLPEVKETVQGLLDEVMDTGIPFHGIEYPVPIKRFGKHETSYFNFLYHPLKEDGVISGIIVTVTDVSESVRAKHALAESEKRFRNMVMQSPIPMTIFRGKDFIIEMANKEMFENIWRKEEAEVIGKPALEVFPELNDQKYPELLNHVLATGVTHREIESPALVQGDDGMKKFYLDFEYAPLFETDRTISGIIITVNDVTEKVEARQKLEESELYARSVFYNSPVAKMVFLGHDMVINTINESMLEMLGRDSSIIGKPFMEAMPELLSTPLMDRLRHVLATGETHHETEEKISFLKYGKLHTGYFDYIYKPLHNTAGDIYGIMCTCTEVTDQVISKQKIKESENRFRSLIEDAPVATCLFTGKDMVIEVANEIMLKYWGKDTSVIGKPFLEALREMEGQPFIGILDEIYETGMPYSSTDAEARIVVDGKLQTFYFDFTYKPIYDSENNLIGIVDMAVDVTETVLAKKKLQESEQNFRTLAVKESLARQEIQQSEERARLAIDAAELGTYEWTIGTNETITSERFMYIFGFEWQEVFDREKLVQRIHPEDRHIHTAAHVEALKTGILSYEARVVWPDESVHWIKIKGKIVYDEENTPKKMLGTVMDITDLKRIEFALKTSESRLAEAQRIATIGNWEYGYNDKSFYCSDEVYRILATSAEEFVPSFYNLFRIIHPQDIKKLSRTLSFTSKTGLPFNIDFRIITEDNNTKHINSQGYVVLDDNQKIIKIIGTLQDITMRKLVEEELIEAKRVSEKSLRYKEQFLANMSHEIRTPMNAIVGFTELILNTPLQTEQKQFLEAIKTSGENLLVIINDILDFSKVEAGAIHFEHIDFKLSEVVSTLTDLMLPKSVEKGIKLSLAINPAITDNLIGDPTRLNQILINLVGNAIKFTEKGEIKIAVEPIWENDKSIEVKFAVSDTGIGIDEKMQTAIFDVFTQTSSDTTRKYGGSGLGLAIVKQFVEKQGGEVFLESSLGVGSTFSFTLTFDKSFTPDIASHKISEEPSLNIAPLTLSVLLVEDNKLNQLLANKALSDLGWKVDIADNGIIAVEKVAKNDYDIILMDIQLPEMDGYEATKCIRSNYEAPKSQVPIIAVTAHAMQSEAQKCHDAGMDGYISKPFSPKMLVEGILNVLEKDKKRDTPIH